MVKRPKLVIILRNGSRAITKEDSLVKMAKRIRFQVQVLRPNPTIELAKNYEAFNSSDTMIGARGAPMTHFVFMNLNSVFIQVIPLGAEWAAEGCYGGHAKKLGLTYIGYQIQAKESSLYYKYDKHDRVIRDPKIVALLGWKYTKSIYLDNQNVTLNFRRFRRMLGSLLRSLLASNSYT